MYFDQSQNTEDVMPGWTLKEITELVKWGYFDHDFYLHMYPDIASSGVNPLWHYLQLGWREGRRPSAQIGYPEIEFLQNIKEQARNPLNLFDRNRQLEAQ
jgi:hypothetical protein